MDTHERLFLQFIGKFTPEDVRDSITMDIDLGKLVLEEYDDSVITEFRHFAALYDTTHPGKRSQLSDIDRSATNVLEWLKVNRPDLGFEIQSYEAYPTAAAIGLTTGGTVPYIEQTEHVGIAWLKRNIQSLANVLL